MPHPDEGLIHAWLDDELDAAEAARVEALVANDPEWAAAAAEARGLIAASSRIVGALDHVPARVVPPRVAKPRRTPWWMARVAALLVVVVGASLVLRDGPEEARLPSPLPTSPATRVAADPVPPARAATTPTARGNASGVTGKRAERVLADESRSAPALAAPLAAGTAPGAAADVAAAKAEQVPSVTCFEIVAGPSARISAALEAQQRAAASPPTALTRARLDAALPNRQLLALAEPAPRSEGVVAAPREAANMPVAKDARLPINGLLRRIQADSAIVTWRDDNRAITARVATRPDSLSGTWSGEGGAGGLFKAVRTACPRP